MTFSKYNKLIQVIALMLICNVSLTVCATEKNLHKVEDVAYGVSLYHFYQGKYFSSISDLLVAEQRQEIANDTNNPRLLLGGLYLSYGLYSKSSDVFQGLLESGDLNISAEVKDRAWYLLGKSFYENGMLDEAGKSLVKVKDSLQENDEEERLYWLNTIFLKKYDVVSAVDMLYKMQDRSIWRYYAVFNTATYLIKAGTYPGYAKQLLVDLSLIVANSYEEKLLVDKANLALAYVALKNNNQQEAVQYFLKIRLGGGVTSEALLGLGWAQYRNEDYDNSIASWMNLVSSQTKTDLMVQEALISIPYAFEKKQEDNQALFEYGLAVESYKAQIDETQKLVDFINSEQFITQINPANMGDEVPPVFNGLQDVNPLMYRYLSKLISSEGFQSSVRSYQQTRYLSYKLNRWQYSMPSLKMMLSEKRATYKNKLASTLDNDSLEQVKELIQRKNNLQIRLASIESNQKFYSLATAKESKYIEVLSAAKSSLERMPFDNADTDELKFKHRLMQGLLRWRLETEYPARLWQVKKQAKRLDAATNRMQNTLASLKQAFKSAPKEFSQFDARIANKEVKIDQLKSRVGNELIKQEKHLRTTALNALEVHRNQIRLYHDRALFAKARLYDSMMVKE